MAARTSGRRRLLRGRALLVASAGVASIAYIACSNNNGNLVGSGNLMLPATDGAPNDQANDYAISSGNLVAPPPTDAGDGGDASDATLDAPSDGPTDAPEGG